MAYEDRLKERICMTLACQTLKKKHYGLQVFKTCKLEEKNSLCNRLHNYEYVKTEKEIFP